MPSCTLLSGKETERKGASADSDHVPGNGTTLAVAYVAHACSVGIADIRTILVFVLGLVVLSVLAHLVLEGYRWQMVPAYGLTALTFLAIAPPTR